MGSYRIHRDYLYSELYDEGMLTNTKDMSCFYLNPVANRMLHQILNTTDDEIAVANLAEQIEAPVDVLRKAYLSFRNDLLKQGFIEEVESQNETVSDD